MRSAAILLLSLLGSQPAFAQLQDVDRDFDANRLRPAVGKEGILNVNSGAVPEHLAWDVALSFNWADDPIILVEEDADGNTRRVVSLLKGRLDAHLQGALSLFGWVQVGLDLPVSVYQWRNAKATERFGLAQLGPAGIGDLGVTPKLRILDRATFYLDLAILARFTLPTAYEKENFLGEETLTFEPELALSFPLWDEQLELAANIAGRIRESVLSDVHATRVEHELILRVGAAFHFEKLLDVPLSAKLTFEGFTAASEPFANFTEGGGELLAGIDYQLTDLITIYGGAGGPLSAAYSIPDFRAFVGVRIAHREDDNDDDGIVNSQDSCPEVAEDDDDFADSDGCPDLDNDGDGVLDTDDAAPLEPEDVDDFEDDDGAPDLDNDGDGVLDFEDGAPLEPEDRDGFEDGDGIPDPDNDRDGLLDVNERCPGEREDFDGFEDDDGCPDPDNDRDGVLDVVDEAPNLPEDADGFEDDDGAPDPDNDRDGFLDAVDACPNQAEIINGVKDDDGCPDEGASKTKITGKKIEILEKVYFDTGKATIQARSLDLLNQVAAVLKANPQVTGVRIEGHTDSRGSRSANQKLSQARAEAVRAFVLERGVAEDRLLAAGFGEARPIASNRTSRGRETNRRVEFVITHVEGEPVDGPENLQGEGTSP